MYNQFTPYGYPQFGQQANGYPQNMYMTNNATAQATGGMEVVPVSLIQQVEQVQVQPGQRKMVLVQNEPVIASRSADNMGLVTTEYYRLEKFIPGASVSTQAVDYVTRQEFNAFVESLKGGKMEGTE